MKKRRYRLKRRAAKRDETRERIVAATVALHEELGPAATSISAVADRAGVQRLTVYRHFPTERDLFAACSSSWFEQHPPPELGKIGVNGAREYTRAVLLALYRYYAESAQMLTSVYRDVDKLPTVAEVMTGFDDYLEAAKRDLLVAWAPSRSKRLRATLGHALRFSTWQSLDAQGLGSQAMAELACSWVGASTQPYRTTTRQTRPARR